MIKKFVVFLLVVIAAAMWWLLSVVEQMQSEKLLLDEAFTEVKAGETFRRLCQRWQQVGAINSCLPYNLYSKLAPEQFALQSGVYKLQGLPVLEALTIIRRGQQHRFSFTIIEGEAIWTVKKKLAAAPYLHFDIDNLSEQLGLQQDTAEGWLYPDTYYYHGNDSALALMQRAHQKMQQVLQQQWQQRKPDLPLQSPYEALILASIIEKETGVHGERSKVASVFINRLRKGMRLQTDPTVIYGIGESFDGDIKRKDLRELTPYNTYRIDGLPPTPIAMPSTAAIHAALNPQQTEYFYFVASGTGGHQFSKTLAEHNRAVQRYLKQQRQ